MKTIDENFFKQKVKIKTLEEQLEPDEKVLWKGCPKKTSYAINKSIQMMPIAIIWGLIDFGLLFGIIIPQGVFAEAWFFLIPFFALHLMPVWIWLAQLIKASKELRGTKYVITNRRILEFKSGYGYISTSVEISKLTSVSIKRSGIDKLLLVGDIYLSAKSGNLVLFDIPRSEFIYGKIREMHETKAKSKDGIKFYEEHNECLHCGSFFPLEEAKCPNCGAPIKNKKKK